MTPERLKELFDNPNDKFNQDVEAIRFFVKGMIVSIKNLTERVELLEKNKGKKK